MTNCVLNNPIYQDIYNAIQDSVEAQEYLFRSGREPDPDAAYRKYALLSHPHVLTVIDSIESAGLTSLSKIAALELRFQLKTTSGRAAADLKKLSSVSFADIRAKADTSMYVLDKIVDTMVFFVGKASEIAGVENKPALDALEAHILEVAGAVKIDEITTYPFDINRLADLVRPLTLEEQTVVAGRIAVVSKVIEACKQYVETNARTNTSVRTNFFDRTPKEKPDNAKTIEAIDRAIEELQAVRKTLL